METTKKLKILRNSYKKILKSLEENPELGVCSAIEYLNNVSERERVWFHFTENKPSEKTHLEFFNDPSFIGDTYWWKDTARGVTQRRLFVKKMIAVTSPPMNWFSFSNFFSKW